MFFFDKIFKNSSRDVGKIAHVYETLVCKNILQRYANLLVSDNELYILCFRIFEELISKFIDY